MYFNLRIFELSCKNTLIFLMVTYLLEQIHEFEQKKCNFQVKIIKISVVRVMSML
jgi:hypothetical protein